MNDPLLCIDRGNSLCKIAARQAGRLRLLQSIPGQEAERIQQAVRHHVQRLQPRAVVVSSVVPAADRHLKRSLPGSLPVYFIRHRHIRGIINTYQPAEAIGIDRLIALSRAYELSSAACVVCDFGTACTVTACDNDGRLLGGMIMPGVHTQLSSLSNRTAQLPAFTPFRPQTILARTTRDGIMSGVFHNLLAATRLALKSAGPGTRSAACFLTGGWAGLFAADLAEADPPCRHEPLLLLQGAADIFDRSFA